MVIKNFFSCLVVISFVFLLASCESLRTTSRPQGPEPIDAEVVEPGKSEPVVVAPEFLKKDAPRLGLILGPGGALSYGHIGFLQELENNKIPVHAIAGIEWGALVAGAYAMEKKAHGVEWKLLKLPINQFEDNGFFSSGKKAAQVSAFNKFLDSVFKGKDVSDLKLAFTCPFVNIKKGQQWTKQSGGASLALKACWPSQPHFSISTLAANLNGVASVAQSLREKGADLIVYVDVLPKSDLLTSKERSKQPEVAYLWTIQKSLSRLLRPPVVDEVIYLDISGSNINSYKALRSIIRKGQVKSKSIVKSLGSRYAY